MARIRQYKPAFFTDDKVGRLSRDARLFFFGVLSEADDEGRLVDAPKRLAGVIYPFDEDVTPKKVERWINELEAQQMVLRYQHEGGKFLFVRTFKDHQKMSHPTPSTLPPPPPPPGPGQSSGAPPEKDRSAAGEPPEDFAPVFEGVVVVVSEGVVEGVSGVPSSSSKLNLVGRAVADDDEGSPTKKALALMADRRIAAAVAAGNVILNPGGYRRKTLESVNGELGDKAEAMLKAGATPEAVADKLVPLGSASANRWPEFEPPPDPDEPLASVNGLAGVRSALGGGA